MALWSTSVDDLRARLTTAKYQEVFDDDGDGVIESADATLILEDAEALVTAAVVPNVTLPISPVPPFFRKLVLDFAVVEVCRRCPEIMRDDGEKLEKSARWQLEKLRSGVLRLDGGDTPTNVLVSYRTGTKDNYEPGYGFVKDGTGAGGF